MEQSQSPSPKSFEEAYSRLEELLNAMSSSEQSLESALNCYEEAEKLIEYCNNRLNAAEKRIEKLIKNRQGEIVYDESGQPKTEPFTPK